MNTTSCIVRGILRDYPLSRFDCTLAWLIYYQAYLQYDQYPREIVKIPSFVRAWNRYKSMYL